MHFDWQSFSCPASPNPPGRRTVHYFHKSFGTRSVPSALGKNRLQLITPAESGQKAQRHHQHERFCMICHGKVILRSTADLKWGMRAPIAPPVSPKQQKRVRKRKTKVQVPHKLCLWVMHETRHSISGVGSAKVNGH